MRAGRLMGMGLAAFLLFVNASPGQDSLGVQKLSEIYDWKWLKGVIIADSLAFVASYGSGLRIVNIQDNANPYEISGCLNNKVAQSIAYFDNYIFPAYGDTMSIVDVSNPLMPQVLGSCETGSTILSMAAMPDYLLAACGDSGLMILDISDAAAPFLASNLPLPGAAEDLCIMNDQAFIAGGEAGLLIINVENPLAPVIAGQYDSPYVASAVDAQGNYAYLGDSGAGLRVVDISNPAAPLPVGYAPVHGEITDLKKEGNYVFMVQNYIAPYGNEHSLKSIDVSSPNSPVIGGACYFDGSVYALSISGTHTAAATMMGLRVVDLSDSSQPQEVGFLYYNLLGEQIGQRDQYLYLSNSDSVWIFDVADPAAPLSVKLFQANSHVSAVQVQDSYLFAAGYEPTLQIFDITLPLNPVLLCSFDLTNSSQEMLIQDSLLFLIGRLLGLAIVDISDHSAPVMLNILNFSGNNWLYDIAAKDHCVYVLEGDGFRVVDVTNPSAPIETAFMALPDWGSGLAVYTDYLYCAAYDSGMITYDISNPQQPLEIGRYLSTWGKARDILIQGNHLILSCSGGLCVLDIANPANPVEVGFYSSENEYSVFAWENYVLAEEYHCLNLYDISIALPAAPEADPVYPSSFRLHPPHPNPFNPSTVASFELRVPSHVSLRVYDTAGRLITTLAEGWCEAGRHQAKFDGTDLPSGIYLARLTVGDPRGAGDFQQTKKLVLLK